uniref:Uncharacterized protein n=1 Tax=Peronospora matthiolae TaxID=2874970 RepID=A0AAV1UTJ6_9STRA
MLPVCREREEAPVSVQDEDIVPDQTLPDTVATAKAAATIVNCSDRASVSLRSRRRRTRIRCTPRVADL